MTTQGFNIDDIRNNFPLLDTQVNGKQLVYFDNAATTQKPTEVLKALDDYYKKYNSNVHRGVHLLSQQATDAYEAARINVASFIHAKHSYEVIFTRGTTEGINLVSHTFGRKFLQEGDNIVITAMEHHSNIVPWQMICEERNAKLRILPMDQNGVLKLDELPALLDANTKLISFTYVSNSLGTVNDVKEIIRQAHEKNIPVLIDAAQAIQHMPLNVQDLDVDFMVFSGHKIYGPTGIGVLYGKEEWLNVLPPWQGGGDMIKSVSFEKTIYNELPYKFEAGTPDIAGAIGLSVAIDYVRSIGIETIQHREHELINYAMQQLATIEGLTFIGNATDRAGGISFSLKGLHPFDVGELLDKQGIAVRTGHHCTQPVMDFFQIPGTIRASFAFYNTKEEVDILVAGVRKAIAMLS